MEQEEKILTMLVECWNEFIKLDKQHPDEQRELINLLRRKYERNIISW